MNGEWIPLLLVALTPLVGVALMVFLNDHVRDEASRRKVALGSFAVMGLVGLAQAISHGWSRNWGLSFWAGTLMFLLAAGMFVHELRLRRVTSDPSTSQN